MTTKKELQTAAHAELGASSSERWMNCEGSPREIAKIPVHLREKTSVYAYEGTAAHALMERCLRKGHSSAKKYKGWTIALFEEANGHTKAKFFKPETLEENALSLEGAVTSFVVNQNMMEAVYVVLEHVAEEIERLRKEYPRSKVEMFVEERVYPLKDYPEMYGTADIILVAVNREVVVIDYKHGAGMTVDAIGNTQIRYYGLGGLRKVKATVNKVKVTIVQPRALHEDGTIRSEVLRVSELKAWGKVLSEAVKKTRSPTAKLHAGSWCKDTWCHARGVCPELRRSIENAAQMDFDDDPEELERPTDPKKIGHLLSWIPMFEAWKSGIEALAYQIAQNGGQVADHKLIYGRSNRKFREDISQNKLLFRLEKFTKLSREKLFSEPELKSATQIEKLVPPKKRKLFNAKFVVKPQGKLTLVHESNKAPAVSVNPADDFEDVVDE